MKKYTILMMAGALATVSLQPGYLHAKRHKEPPAELFEQKGRAPKKSDEASSSSKKKASDTSSSHKSSSKHPPKQLPLPVAEELAFGSWLIKGDGVTTIKDQDAIAFPISEVQDSEIVFKDKAFKLPSKGIYMVTLGINTQGTKNRFDLLLSGKSILGGKLTTVLDGSLAYGTGTITVMFPAKAGEQLQIVNKSGCSARLGAGEKDTIAAYLSIVQMR